MNPQTCIDTLLEGLRTRSVAHPIAVFVVGPLAAGKTVYRKTHYREGFAQIDSLDIFQALTEDVPGLDFPNIFGDHVEQVGRAITHRAIERRLDLVVEVQQNDTALLNSALFRLNAIGYVTDIQTLSTERTTCEWRHYLRGYKRCSLLASPMHVGWIIDACQRRAN